MPFHIAGRRAAPYARWIEIGLPFIGTLRVMRRRVLIVSSELTTR